MASISLLSLQLHSLSVRSSSLVFILNENQQQQQQQQQRKDVEKTLRSNLVVATIKIGNKRPLSLPSRRCFVSFLFVFCLFTDDGRRARN